MFSKIGSYFAQSMVLETSQIEEGKDIMNLGASCIYAPGLAVLDEIGVRTARHSGWLMGINMLWEHFEGDFYLSIQKDDKLKDTLSHFSLGVINCNLKRTGQPSIRYHQCKPEVRQAIGREIFSNILKNITGPEIIQQLSALLKIDGYVICDLKRNMTSARDIKATHNEAITYIKKVAGTTNIVIPILTTPMAMEALSRKINLTEQRDTADSVVYNPAPATSTILEHSNFASLSCLDDDISALAVNQSMFLCQLNTLNESLTEGGTVSTDHVNDLEEQLKSTLACCETITTKFAKVKEEYEVKAKETDALITYKEKEIDDLKLGILGTQEDYAVVKQENQTLSDKLEQLEQNYRVEQEELQNTIAKAKGMGEELQKQEHRRKSAESKITHQQQDLEDYQDNVKQLETTLQQNTQKRKIEKNKLIRDINSKRERLDTLEDTVTAKQGEINQLTRQITDGQAKIMELDRQLVNYKALLSNIETELEKLSEQNRKNEDRIASFEQEVKDLKEHEEQIKMMYNQAVKVKTAIKLTQSELVFMNIPSKMTQIYEVKEVIEPAHGAATSSTVTTSIRSYTRPALSGKRIRKTPRN